MRSNDSIIDSLKAVLSQRVFAIAVLSLSAATGVSKEQDAPRREQSHESAVIVDNESIRIDLEPIRSAAWRAAIEAVTKTPAMRVRRQFSLMRVILESSDAKAEMEVEEPRNNQPTVNGIPLFIPAGDRNRLAEGFPSKPEPRATLKLTPIQLCAVKLLTPSEVVSGGGGMYRELESGGFVVLEHINSSRRRDGRDCVHVGSMTHHQGELWIQVPPRGELGIVGDVVLKKTAAADLGRIVVEVLDRSKSGVRIQNLQVGCVAVGNIYGTRFPFVANGISATPEVSPGPYKILLPDFDMAESRWEATVEPGQITYLRFVAESQQNVRLDEQKQISFADAARPQ